MSKKKPKVVEQDQKIKAAADKVPFALLPWRLITNLGLDEFPSALEGLAWVFEYGSRKYAPYNFAKAEADHATALRYLSAYFRHTQKAKREVLDDESHLPHLDHASACLVMLLAICYHNNEWLQKDAEADLVLDAKKDLFVVHDLFQHSGKLIGGFDSEQEIYDFIKPLATATYQHFADVEDRLKNTPRSRGNEVSRVA